MPPRQQRNLGGGKDKGKGGPSGGAGGGGSIFGALLGSKKKEPKTKVVIKPVGGLVNTLGWLWRGGKPLPKAPPPKESKDGDDDDEDEDEDEPMRSLPAFVIVHVVPPGRGDEFKLVSEKRDYAVLEVCARMTVGEFRVRLRDHCAEWQELKLNQKEVPDFLACPSISTKYSVFVSL